MRVSLVSPFVLSVGPNPELVEGIGPKSNENSISPFDFVLTCLRLGRTDLNLMVVFHIGILLLSTTDIKAMHQSEARARQKSVMNITKSTAPSLVPGFVSANPPEVNLDQPQALERGSESVFLHNEVGIMLKTTAETRPYFHFDLDHDPLIKNANASVQNPEAVLRSNLYNKNVGDNYVIKTCREAKPPIEFRCSKNLVPPTIHVDPAKYSNFWCTSGKHRPDDPACQAKRYYPTPRMYEPEKVHASPEAWTSDCGTMGTTTQNRSCRLVTTTCPGGKETRTVISTVGPERTPTPRQVTRPCWRYEYVYACAYPSVNTCGALRTSSCEQIQSTCLNKRENVCIEWEQTYKCSQGGRGGTEQISTGGVTLSPESLPEPSPPNPDMAEAIAKLYVLKDVQDDLRLNEKANVNAIQIFKGDSRKCTIAFGKFKNCCTNGKGWGVSLNLSGCNGEEKDLAKRQKKGLCVKLGTYCAEKALGVCIRKKTAHCCFPTKLARILHQQGRPQLGVGWGKPKHPQCRGFTVDELSRIDFDRLDLSELFTEMMARTKAINRNTVNVVGRNLSDRVGQMTHGFKSLDLQPSQSTNKPTGGEF